MVAAHPGQIMDAKSGARDDLETVASQARHRQIALDAAVHIEHLRVGDRPRWLIHLVIGDALAGRPPRPDRALLFC